MKNINQTTRQEWRKAYRQYRINGRCKYELMPICSSAMLGAKIVYWSNVRDYIRLPYISRKRLIHTEKGTFYRDAYGLLTRLFYY